MILTMNSIKHLIAISLVIFMAISCSKTSNAPSGPQGNGPAIDSLSYGDSVFYLSIQAGDYVVYPAKQRSGRYSAYPEGIDLDENSGAINVTKSETGLKYKVSFTPAGSNDSVSTNVIISGINFLDGFYKLNSADSVVHPIYNAASVNPIPGIGSGSQFDETASCNNNGCAVNTTNGQINLAQTVRNGVFGASPSNNDRHEFDLNYGISDKSDKAQNHIRIKLYYFDTMNDVTQEVYDIISSREGTIIDSYTPWFAGSGITVSNSRTTTFGVTTKSASPRPPCIFIVSR